MVVYSIKDLEKISGVKAHTLRIWEKRYGIIQPKRTVTNVRYYLDEDLRHVLNIALLNKNGMKISKIAQLNSDEIKRKVAEFSEVDQEFENHLDALTLSMLEMDEYKFEKILNANFSQSGFRKSMMDIVYPLLNKLSVMWISGSINGAQENFVTQIIRQKTIAAIDKLSIKKEKNLPFFLIYLPEEEDHELSLLFVQYILKELGYRVINLGQNINIYDLIDAVEISRPDFLFTIINEANSQNPVQQYVDQLMKNFSHTRILLSGLQVVKQSIRSHPNLEIKTSFGEIIEYLESLKINWN